MVASPARTVIVPARLTAAYGILPWPTALEWPMAEPDAALDYYLDATAPIADVSDVIVSASVTAAPSGAGELAAQSISVNGALVSVWLAGGVAGRRYKVRVQAATLAGRTFEWVAGIQIDPALGVSPSPAPPSTGFGAPIYWHLVTPLRLDLRRALSAGLIAAL